MARFAVLLHGKNVILLQGGQRIVGGVYCWRCVEAESREAAIPLAIEKLWRDPLYQEEVWNSPDDPPSICGEEVDDLDEQVDLEEGDSACVFYIDEEEESRNRAVESTPGKHRKKNASR